MTTAPAFADVLTTALTWCLAGATAWLAAITVLCFAEGLLTGGIDRCGRLAPGVVRSLVRVVLGISVSAAPVLLASAAQGVVPPPDAPPQVSTARAVLGLPLPERPVAGPATHPETRPRLEHGALPEQRDHRRAGIHLPRAAAATAPSSSPIEREVVVRAGDCLWAIAQREGVAWPELYRLNRAAIGPAPDLIHPGLRLRLPASEEAR